MAIQANQNFQPNQYIGNFSKKSLTFLSARVMAIQDDQNCQPNQYIGDFLEKIPNFFISRSQGNPG